MVTKTIYIIAVLIILFAVTMSQTVAYGITDKKPPIVKITLPAPDAILPAGTILVQGTASDNHGSGVKIVQVRVDNSVYLTAIPKSTGDWSTWSISENITISGSHKIEAKATDNAGNQNLNSITITIAIPPAEIDTTPPSIIPPPNVIAEATGIITSVAIGTSTVSDDKDPSPVVINNSPSSFSLGITIVTWTATDSSGNSASATQTVTVVDTTPPSIITPANISGVEATDPSGTPVVFSTTASDLVDGPVTPVCIPSSGSTFALGITTVNCTAIDTHGNTGSGTFTVGIVDTTSPSITAPSNITAEATDQFTTIALGTPTVNDLVDNSPSITNDAPSGFQIGTTTVTWTATDSSGNSASATQTVTITEPSNDAFGIKKIYPTKTNSVQWYMNTDNVLNDTLFSTIPVPSSSCTTPKTCTLLYKNSAENTWHVKRIDVPLNEGIRMVVKSPPNTLWLNTEMTGYYKLRNSTYYPQEFIHVTRSGSPHASTCEGYSYYAGITYDGNIAKVQKSLYHGGDGLGYSQTLYVRGVTTPLNDRWIGMKTMTYNINNNAAVKLEIWIDDLDDNNWRKVFEQVDNGWTIPGNPATFGCINPLTGLPSSNDIILWGGTEQQFRADNAEIDFDRLSIREIIPPVP